MENGHAGNLLDKFSGLAVSDDKDNVLNDNSVNSNNNSSSNDNNDSLFQVKKAVEAAEAAIKQLADENSRLRNELHRKSQELQKHVSALRRKLAEGSLSLSCTRLEELVGRRPHGDQWKESFHGPYEVHTSIPSHNSLEDRIRRMGNDSVVDTSNNLVLHKDLKPNVEHAALQSRSEIQSESSKNNGTLKMLSGGQAHLDTPGPSQLSSPSTTSLSPTRYQIDGEYDPRFSLSGQGLMPVAEVNKYNSLWKQDLVLKVREHEEEIMLLRKQLAEYSIKEAQIRNEKYVLERRIAYMRLAFDQQQQDLVDAASKALSYRQDIIEENIHLTYQLQAAQQERTTFVQSLLPLLAEYSLQPSVADAQSIVSNVKVLFKHLQEKLILTESKLKESQYQLAPWRSDSNHSNFALQSPAQSSGAAFVASNKNGLELVAQPTYSHGNIPTNSDAQATADLDLLGRRQAGLGVVGKNLDDDMRRPLASRDLATQDISVHLASTHDDSNASLYGEETANKQVKFHVPVNSSEMDDADSEEHQNERDHSSTWASANSPYTTTLDDPNTSYSPYLPPVLEEPSSSYSEAADDDPLPAIEGLQISGEAIPGRQLQACGYSINGTTSCNFEWVRHLEDGRINYIDGAKQPNYLVTADDVDTYLAIEVQPLDDRKRKGELVKVFANEHRKITCDPEMQNHIERTLYSGHMTYKVALSTGYLDIWEPATLAIKREGYSIKCTGPGGLVTTEKFSTSTTVSIPYGSPTEFFIMGSSGNEHLLRTDSSTADVSCSRDTIVLTLRLFIIRASERRKGKKRVLFFNK